MATVKCSVCGYPYDAEHVNVLGHEQDLWFMSVFCPHCRSKGLVAAVVREEKAKTAQHSPPEKAFCVDGPAVGVDDVLDIHNFLKGFDGDFRGLFSGTEKL